MTTQRAAHWPYWRHPLRVSLIARNSEPTLFAQLNGGCNDPRGGVTRMNSTLSDCSH